MDNMPQQELQAVCRNWAAAISGIGDRDGRIAYFRAELPMLLGRQPFFEGVLRGLLAGNPYPDLRQGTLFENELILYREPGSKFSLRLYIFGPGEHTPVHDHLSWGVSGPAFGQLEVVRFHREGFSPEPNRVRLAVAARSLLAPGEIETTLPFDEGIHRTGNPAAGTTLMVSIYGRPLRRLYMQCYNIESGYVDRRYPPHMKKRMLAEQALAAMGKESAA
jgi:predicted metal-dependent enzyme (double-stranded beta helix superfamily)